MRKGKNGQADLDKGFKTGYFSFFNHQACVFYLCDMNYRAVQEKRKHLKYQGFLPWNKGRSIGQSKKTVQYSYPCPYETELQSGYFRYIRYYFTILKGTIYCFIVADHCKKSKCLFGAPSLFFGQIFSITFLPIHRAFDHIHDHLVKLCGVF